MIPYPRTIVREFHELLPGCLDFLVIDILFIHDEYRDGHAWNL